MISVMVQTKINQIVLVLSTQNPEFNQLQRKKKNTKSVGKCCIRCIFPTQHAEIQELFSRKFLWILCLQTI